MKLINLGVTVDGDGRTAKAQAGYQIAGLAVALGIAILGGIVTGKEFCLLLNSFTPNNTYFQNKTIIFAWYICIQCL